MTGSGTQHVTERRITLRLLAYWEKLRGLRDMPSENDINPDDIGDLWSYCFMVHVSDLHQEGYNYIYLGDSIIEAYRERLNEDDPAVLAAMTVQKIAPHCDCVVETRRPVLDEGEFVNLAQHRVKYRQCLLPLGENGKVEAIFGGMRFKIYE